MRLDAGETEGRPPWLRPRQSCRDRQGPDHAPWRQWLSLMLLSSHFSCWHVELYFLGLLDGAMGPVLANKLPVEVTHVISGLSH